MYGMPCRGMPTDNGHHANYKNFPEKATILVHEHVVTKSAHCGW